MASRELEGSPFGRRLSILVHRLPRGAGLAPDWEVERGYSLEILSESLFALSFRPREEVDGGPTLPLLASIPLDGIGPASRARQLLVWQKDLRQSWEEFASTLRRPEGWQAGLIMSSSVERGAAMGSYLSERSRWKGLACPVIQVFQDSPPETFFTVEKNLFALGRVGRRVQRLAGVRRWLPW